MTTVTSHLTVVLPLFPDARELTLFLLGILIMLSAAALRWIVRRTRVVVVVSGTSALLVVLAILFTAYMIKSGVA
ncbi:hypothetical protein ITP53_21770 [Nonomuraea sp. K274]|uniref:Uncharacterized protein n=1 Tax=Nonomuraea cypriaca TaxID=1187855 RepID=A0A931AFK9_9ACTN|nr:hypothetical protein [Nonomuraea cypriaca]MBF8188312.1 hypothetical protein [Nonomuraea cypriaca]